MRLWRSASSTRTTLFLARRSRARRLSGSRLNNIILSTLRVSIQRPATNIITICAFNMMYTLFVINGGDRKPNIPYSYPGIVISY